jgi:trimeric autotransporter adhesin
VGELAANGTATASTSLQIPADTLPGSYYVIGRADWNGSVDETSDTNNDRSSAAIRIGGDLAVTALSASATGMANGPISVTNTTKNQGAAPVAESTTAFYLSLNGAYEPADQFLGNRLVGALAPSGTNTLSMELILPSGTAPGIYYVIAVADSTNAVSESLENNNIRASAGVRVGPDLSVTSLSAPSTAVAGTSISATDTTKNLGGEMAPASVTSYYLSSNSSLDAADVFLVSRDVPSVGAGLTQSGSVMVPIPTSTAPGNYYIIAKGDGNGAVAEAEEINNTRVRSISITAAP